MVPIVVRENQTVRGVEMSDKHEPLWNIVKICVITFVLLFVWSSAFGDIKGWDSKYSKKEVKEETVKEEVKEVETEEEPDCE